MTVQELFNAAQQLNPADQLRPASQLMQSVVQNRPATNTATNPDDDPLIGLFAGSPNLSSQSEDILAQDINSTSGFSWKA